MNSGVDNISNILNVLGLFHIWYSNWLYRNHQVQIITWMFQAISVKLPLEFLFFRSLAMPFHSSVHSPLNAEISPGRLIVFISGGKRASKCVKGEELIRVFRVQKNNLRWRWINWFLEPESVLDLESFTRVSCLWYNTLLKAMWDNLEKFGALTDCENNVVKGFAATTTVIG